MKPKSGPRFDIILIGIAILSAFLNIYNIWTNLYANTYYTSAVTSMLQSWHNFFFASFDPAGFVTVDKPPVAFWVQTIFAYFFGVHGWSVILPQALAGIGSVLLIYKLVKPNFGITAARFASLTMACTPIAVAVSRTNNIDSLLVFTLVLAAWMLFKGVRTKKAAWVLASFAMIGVGFNMKMLQAYMVVPAFYLFYLIAFKSEWKKKLAILAASTVILVGLSLSWAVIVDSIPADSRPYIDSSQTNSVLELALGYNGIQRLTGMNRGGQVQNAKNGQMSEQPQMQNNDSNRPQGVPEGFGAGHTRPDGNGTAGGMPPGMQGDGPGDGGRGQMNAPGNGGNQGQMAAPEGNAFRQVRGMSSGMFGTGQAGPLRLFQSELSDQASWLLPLVGFACLSLLAGIRRRKPLTDKQKETLFWMAWLLPAMGFFSVAGFFHHYYLIMLAPPIAALTGAGWQELYNQYRGREGWKMWLLPAAILAATLFEWYILQPYTSQIGSSWVNGLGMAGIVLTLALILAAKKEKIAHKLAIAGMLVLLAAPLYWSITPILYGDNNMMPKAGLSQSAFNPGQNMKSLTKSSTQFPGQGTENTTSSNTNDQLIDYLLSHNTGEKFLFATTDSNTAAPYIIKTGKAVMSMGGFSGSDQILTAAKLKQMVQNKEVKYFLISSAGGGRGGSSEVLDWIRNNSTVVPNSEWQSNSAQSNFMGRSGSTLYLIKQ